MHRRTLQRKLGKAHAELTTLAFVQDGRRLRLDVFDQRAAVRFEAGADGTTALRLRCMERRPEKILIARYLSCSSCASRHGDFAHGAVAGGGVMADG